MENTLKKNDTKAGELSTSNAAKPGQFRYYIHDHSHSFRLQLFGHLTSANLSELQGCWSTAKSSVSGRKISLDVKGLQGVDEAGRQWLRYMAEVEGAEMAGSPESAALLQEIKLRITAAPVQAKTRLLDRLLFRRAATIPSEAAEQAKASTQAPRIELKPSSKVPAV